MEQGPAGPGRVESQGAAASTHQFGGNGHDPGTALSLIRSSCNAGAPWTIQPQLGVQMAFMVDRRLLEPPLQPPPGGPRRTYTTTTSRSGSSVEMIIGVPLDTVWAVITDWFGVLYGWPDDLVVRALEGANACPGALRYSTDKVDPGAVWVVERLLAVSPDRNELSYVVEESNVVGMRGHRGSCRLSREALACAVTPRIVTQSGGSCDGLGGRRGGSIGGFREATRVVWEFELPVSAAASGVTATLVRESLVLYIKSMEEFCNNRLA